MRKEAMYYILMTKKDLEAPLMMEYMLEVGEEVNINWFIYRIQTCNNASRSLNKKTSTKNVSIITGTFGNKFIVTPHICLAINDIDYVLQFIDPFVQGNL